MLTDREPPKKTSIRLWTSAISMESDARMSLPELLAGRNIDGPRYYKLLNSTIRDDGATNASFSDALRIVRTMNQYCVRLDSGADDAAAQLRPDARRVKLPSGNMTYRGGDLPNRPDIRSFFKVGKTFRTAQFLSSSNNLSTAKTCTPKPLTTQHRAACKPCIRGLRTCAFAGDGRLRRHRGPGQ